MKRYAVLALTAALMLGGCNEYHADIPEYTTAADRDSDFVPKSDERKPVSAQNEELNNTIREGFDAVEEKASSYNSEIDQKIKDIEKGNAEVSSEADSFESGILSDETPSLKK